MEEELIKFNTAVLAKEKGFNIYRNTQYSKNVNPTTIYNYSEEKCKLFNDVYYVPTQTVLQKWLREKHNIDCISLPWTLDNGDKKYIWMIYKHFSSTKEGKEYDTYEQALEEGLYEGLKLIN